MTDRVTITLSRERAEEISYGMSDLLCWARGFVAASPEDHDRHPMGIEETRSLRIALKAAISDTMKEPK